MKTALVTGDAGFVGRHIRRRLEDDGWHVQGLDVARWPSEDVRVAFRHDVDLGGPFDLVVHCAAVVGGRMTISNDPLAVAVDLEIDAAMFRWAVRTGQRRVVYFSSCAAYPTHLQVEGHVCTEADLSLGPIIGAPDTTYGWAKVTGEVLAQYAEAEGVPVHIFRPFSGYGEDQDESYPFPAYIARTLSKQSPFEVWGNGQQVRDFIHIEDIVSTVMAAIDQDVRSPLNIGNGRATSFNELARLVMAAAGHTAEIQHLLDKPIGPLWRVADTDLLERVRKPRISLEEGILRAVEAAR